MILRTGAKARCSKAMPCASTELFYAAGMPNTPIPEDQFSSDPRYTRASIKWGELQEAFWFLRQALALCSDHGNIGKFNDDPETEHHQVIALICLAIKLVQKDDLGIYYEIENAA